MIYVIRFNTDILLLEKCVYNFKEKSYMPLETPHSTNKSIAPTLSFPFITVLYEAMISTAMIRIPTASTPYHKFFITLNKL